MAARRGAVGTTQPTAQFYHVTTDNRFSVLGLRRAAGEWQRRGDEPQRRRRIDVPRWSLPGIEEYGYIAVDPRDSNILSWDASRARIRNLNEYANVAPEPIRTGPVPIRSVAADCFSPARSGHALFRRECFVQDHRWRPVMAGHQSGPDTRIARNPRESRRIFRRRPGKREASRHDLCSRSVIQGTGHARAGTDDGLIQITRDGGKAWKNVTPPQLTSWSKVSILEASHFDAGTVYAAVNRFRLDDLKPHIYRTRDFGASWQELSPGYPATLRSMLCAKIPHARACSSRVPRLLSMFPLTMATPGNCCS